MLGRGCAAAMRRWTRYMLDSDHLATFREYRALVQLLLWHNPVRAGGVLVLKCPQIAHALGAFAELFPEASFVLTHRDPYRALLSTSTVLQTINQAFLNDPPRLRREHGAPVAGDQAGILAQLTRFTTSTQAR